jgi:hypothetical protein
MNRRQGLANMLAGRPMGPRPTGPAPMGNAAMGNAAPMSSPAAPPAPFQPPRAPSADASASNGGYGDNPANGNAAPPTMQADGTPFTGNIPDRSGGAFAQLGDRISALLKQNNMDPSAASAMQPSTLPGAPMNIAPQFGNVPNTFSNVAPPPPNMGNAGPPNVQPPAAPPPMTQQAAVPYTAETGGPASFNDRFGSNAAPTNAAPTNAAPTPVPMMAQQPPVPFLDPNDPNNPNNPANLLRMQGNAAAPGAIPSPYG